MGMMKTCGLALGALALVASGAVAQEQSTNRVAAKTDWSVFVEDNPTECWGVSTPKEVVNTRDGRVVAVNRGQTLLMVFYRPSAEAKGQVAFTGGYPFASGSTVNMNISGSEFELFTEGEWAWPATTADDAKIIAAMKRGAEERTTSATDTRPLARSSDEPYLQLALTGDPLFWACDPRH